MAGSSFILTSHYLAGGGDKIYSSAGASLLILDTQTELTSSLSKANGLNETRIGAIGMVREQEETLIIVYRNTDVDLVKKEELRISLT